MIASEIPGIRSSPPVLAGGFAALLMVLLAAGRPAFAQESDRRPGVEADSSDLRARVQLVLERGGVSGFAALPELAAALEDRIEADTRALVERRGEPLASVADVTLQVALDSTLTDAEQPVRLGSIRIETGHVLELQPSELRALEEGKVVTAYAGALPAAVGAVRVRAEGTSDGSARNLDAAFRLAIASGHDATIRIHLVEGPDDQWSLSPKLERAGAPPDRGIRRGAHEIPTPSGALASSPISPGISTALEELLDGHYLLVLDRIRALVAEAAPVPPDGRETGLSGENRAAALWLGAAAAVRTGRYDEFRSFLEQLRRSAPESAFRHLAELEGLMAPAGDASDASPDRGPVLSESPVSGLRQAATLLVAAQNRTASQTMRARLYGEAASMEGPLGAVAGYQAGRSWRLAGRSDSAAAAFARARAVGGPLGQLALVGQAEATLAGGDPEGTLELLADSTFERARARTLEELRSARSRSRDLLETARQLVELELELREQEGNDRGEKAQEISERLIELRQRLGGANAGNGLDETLLGSALAHDLGPSTTVAIQKVRARALARLGRTDEARDVLEAARAQAVTVAGRAEVDILRADLDLVTGHSDDARTLFAEVGRTVERELTAERVSADPAAADPIHATEPGETERAVVELAPLVHRWADRMTRTLIPRNPDAVPSGHPLSATAVSQNAGGTYAAEARFSEDVGYLWSLPGAPTASEARVRTGLWSLVDTRLGALRDDLLGSARGMAAARALARLGEDVDTTDLSRATAHAERRLGHLLGPGATESSRTFRERASALERALSRNREVRSAFVDGSLPVAGPDAPLVATRPLDVVRNLKDTREKTQDLLRSHRELVNLELALAEIEDPEDRGRAALDVAERLRQLRDRLEGDDTEEAGPLRAETDAPDQEGVDGWSRTVTDLVARGEASLLAASGQETLRAIRTIHRTEWRARTGRIDRGRAVEMLRDELREAEANVRRNQNRARSRNLAARGELRRALESRREAAAGSPTSPERLRRQRLTAALETARFGEASAVFFAALDATGDGTVGALEEAIRVQRSFAAENPESPLRSAVLLRLAELEVRKAEARFATRIEEGPQRRVSGDRPGPDYDPAIASLERALPEAEGEERKVALRTLGYLLSQQGRHEEAAERLAAYTRELEREDPGGGEALFRQADAVFAAAMERTGGERQAELADATELYRQAADRSTAGSEIEILALYKLGWSRYLGDDYEGATEAFGTLLDRYALLPDEGRPLDLRDEVTEYAAVSLSQLPAPVERAARFARARPPEYEYPMYRSLARTLADQGRRPDAVEVLEAYRSRRPLQADALDAHEAQLRLYESELADSARAQEARLELAHRFGPDNEWWRANPGVRDSAAAAVGEALREAAHYRMRQAQERDDPGLYRGAGELYLRYAETLPPNDSTATMRYMAGEAFYEAGEYRRAGDAYRAAAYEDTGRLDREKEAGINAIASYQEDLREGSATPEAPGGASAASEETAQELYDAVDRFVEAFPEADETPRALRIRAEIAFRRDDLEPARESYRTLIERFPDSDYAPRARKLLGDLAYRAGNHQDAFELWEEAEATARDAGDQDLAGDISGLRAEASLSLADSLADADELEGSAEQYLDFARRHPDDARSPDAYSNAADVLVEAERKGRAVEVLAELLDEHPDHDEAFETAVRRAELLRELGRQREAIEAYADVLDAFPERRERGDVRLRLAELQKEVGDRTGAAESWVRFHRSHPEDSRGADALFSAARILDEADRLERADTLYGEFVDGYPDREQAMAAAVRRFELRREEGTGDVDQARQSLLELASQAPATAIEDHGRLVGLAHIETAEQRFEEYRGINFAPAELTEEALRAQRDRKDRALEEIVPHLEAAVETGTAEPVSRGLYLLGEAHAAYAEFLRDVELPEGTGPDVRRTIEERTSELAGQYVTRAREPWMRLVDLGREKPEEMDLDSATPGLQNPWINRAEESLAENEGRAR